jgi:hypothetical protein
MVKSFIQVLMKFRSSLHFLDTFGNQFKIKVNIHGLILSLLLESYGKEGAMDLSSE